MAVNIPGRIRGFLLLPYSPLPPSPVTQLRTGPPGLFRDVLIKQHGEPESLTARTEQDHDSVLQYLLSGADGHLPPKQHSTLRQAAC